MTNTTDAACIPYVNAGLDLWFEPPGVGKAEREHPREAARRVREAKAVCAACPALAACREYALGSDEGGILGGLTEWERAAIRNPQRTAACGTTSAYARHRRHREQPCDPCLDAYNTYQRERLQARRVKAS